MAKVNIYVSFNGNCEEAFMFYKSVFNKEFNFIGRYCDVPDSAKHHFSNCQDEHIMHVTLPISDETVLMGADMIHATSEEETTSKNFSLYVNTESKSEATQLFNALSDGGSIILPISNQFWGSYYGTCIDKFGIHWKVSFSEN